MKQETANQLIVLAIVKRRVAAFEAEIRAQVLADSDPGDKKNAKAGDARIGTVSVTDPETSWRVTDVNAFTAYVKEHWPTEVHSFTTETVRSAFEKQLLGDPVDETTGEVIPGVAEVKGGSVVQVRPGKDAEQIIADHMIAEGMTFGTALDAIEMKALES
jgi:hypothetical protein